MKILLDLHDEGCRYMVDPDLFTLGHDRKLSAVDLLLNVSRVVLMQVANEIRKKDCDCENCRKALDVVGKATALLHGEFFNEKQVQ